MAAKLARLPQNKLEQYSHPGSNYSYGWSHGKECLKDGLPDTFKAGFYANPSVDDPSTVCINARELLKQYPGLYGCNIWPTADLPELEDAFKELAMLMCTIASAILDRCTDLVAANHLGYTTSASLLHPEARSSVAALRARLQHAPAGVAPLAAPLAEQLCNKGRLLHYFPVEHAQHGTSEEAALDWCGWHTDHGTITGLTSAMFLPDDVGVTAADELACPDASAGLYVQALNGQVVKVVSSPDSLLFQAGQSLQVMSGGLIKATPHCVRGPQGNIRLSRNTFALFCQPNAEDKLQPVLESEENGVEVAVWEHGMSFGAFAERVVALNYRASKS